MTELTAKKCLVYYIYFQVEEAVEEGWLKPEKEQGKPWRKRELDLKEQDAIGVKMFGK